VAVAVICTYPLILSQFGTINFVAAYGAILAFFLFGSMLIVVGLFISSLTESQIIAAVVCLGVLLIVYFMSGLVSLLSGSAIAAVAIITVLVALITLLIKSVTGNAPAAYIVGGCLEGALLILLALKADLLTSGLAAVLNALAAFDRLQNFTYNGLFDWTAIVYYLSGTGLFCFLAAQALEKRRWN
jgi:ABC-2 type transport system permease protein